MPTQATTLLLSRRGELPEISVPRYRVRVTGGKDEGKEAEAIDGRLTVGTVLGVTLHLTDPTVSRYHLELEATPAGIAVRDLESTNGTLFEGCLVREIVVRSGAVSLEIGASRLRLELGDDRASVAAASSASFGRLVGASPAMRAVYATLERAAPTTAPILLTGETGTGKELAARAAHAASPRADKPFEVVDCGGLPPTLIESELFGHERGAFTGAVEHEGSFERAHTGTLFLDELGELPLELQPKLLRAVGEGEVRRLGGKRTRKVDVRIVAATNRDLRRDVNAGRFRADLYYRLAAIEVRLPPLRERLDDLPGLVQALIELISRERGIEASSLLDADFLASLARHAWPGNVRELRNYLEQTAILREPPPLSADVAPGGAPAELPLDGLDALPMAVAKQQWLERFERHYVARLLERVGGNVAEAARQGGVDRATLFRAIKRHGLKAG